MPTAIVTTRENNDSVFLSVNAEEQRSSTSIYLNNHLIKRFDDNFNDFFLGTNLSLKNNVLTIVTQVFRFPSNLESSTVEFKVDGTGNINPSNPIISNEDFPEGAPIVPHSMVYIFI